MARKKLLKFRQLMEFSNVYSPDPKNFEIDFDWYQKIFDSSKELIVEVGCGYGEYTVSLAKSQKEINFLGVDIKGDRIWKGAKLAEMENLKNVGFLRTQIEKLLLYLKPRSVSQIWITFPDPQPKSEKKRLTHCRFLSIYYQLLITGGIIHLKTDDESLFEFSKKSFENNEYKILKVVPDISDLYVMSTEPELVITTRYQEIYQTKKKIKYLKVIKE